MSRAASDTPPPGHEAGGAAAAGAGTHATPGSAAPAAAALTHLQRLAARRGEESRQGAHFLVPLRPARLGPEAAAPRAVVALQRPQAPRREPARVSAVELDRARCLAVHLARADSDRTAVLCGPAAGGAARRDAHHGGR